MPQSGRDSKTLKIDEAFLARFLVTVPAGAGRSKLRATSSPTPRKRKPRDPDGLLDAAQAAERLNITIEQLMAHVDDGALRYVNVGRGSKRPRYRFKPADIDEFESNRTTQGRASCRFSKQQSPRRTTGTASTSNVVGFMAQRAARLARKPKR
jgi:hypothetical protein